MEMRELERRTIEEFDVTGEELMRRAGGGVAQVAADFLSAHGGKSILLIAGTGNNGGDVFAAATELSQSDFGIEVWICGAQNTIAGDAQLHLKKMIRAGILPKEVHSFSDLNPKMPPDLIIDGLLGTGSKGAPRGFMSSLIEWMNEEAQFAFVISIDIPSGVDSDSGAAAGTAVKADLTVTIGLPKSGLIRAPALPYTGGVETIDIGIPPELKELVDGDYEAELIDRSDLLIPRRERAGYKNQYGHTLLIGGGEETAGAIAMSARAALRSGAGLVTIFTPEEIASTVAVLAGPEIMVRPIKRNEIPAYNETYNSILIGPGLFPAEQTKQLVTYYLSASTVPLVLDAGALCVSPSTIAAAKCPVILTPHPGEFARLFETPVTDRLTQARAAAEATGKIIILKGAGTIVAAPDETAGVNLTGNPGMATAGAGDVLAGIAAALLAKNMPPFATAKTAVFLHGTAGDIAALDFGQESMTAVDIIDALPDAFRSLTIR